MTESVLLHPDRLDLPDLAAYGRAGGYEGLGKALAMERAEIVREVERAALRGRGGSGFPTAVKWRMVLENPSPEKYLVCNANEDEPGTFKDQALLLRAPHQLLEGVLIAAYTVGAKTAYLYINGRFKNEIAVMTRALGEARDAGYVGTREKPGRAGVEVRIVESPGLYIGGEETACLEVIEGKAPIPRQKPPFYPAAIGLFGKPTVVNNVETLSNLPHILARGADWFRTIGPANNHGTRVFCLSGDVERPGLYERPMGYSLRDLIEKDGGGIRGGGRLKAVFPGGPSLPLLPAGKIDVRLDFDSMKDAGTGLGTGGMFVVGEDACIVDIVHGFVSFFEHGSCGQCPPCRLGTETLEQIVSRIESGKGSTADIDAALQVCRMIERKGICHLVTAAVQPVQSSILHFRGEYERHVAERACPFRRAKAAAGGRR